MEFVVWTCILLMLGCVNVGHCAEPHPCACHENNLKTLHQTICCKLKIIERIAVLETKQNILEETILRQQHVIDDLTKKQWGSWSEWSACTFRCTGSDVNNGRTQTRTRLLIKDNIVIRNETERRPCNAVQYAGCERSEGPDDQYGVSYDYRDQMAQATCTALLDTKNGHVYAVRRACSNQTVPCVEVCSSLGKTCFNSLHVYNPQTSLPWGDTGKISARMFRYNGCGGSFCGPNFCCCRS